MSSQKRHGADVTRSAKKHKPDHHKQRSESRRHSHGHGSHASRNARSSGHRSQANHRTSAAKVIPGNGRTSVKKQKSEFVCDLQFFNKLPEPPVAPKLLKLDLPEDRLLSYCSGSLERQHKLPVLCDRLLGVPIDLIDLEPFTPATRTADAPGMDPKDAALFAGHSGAGESRNTSSRGETLKNEVFTWLERNKYLQNNLYDHAAKKTVSETQRAQNEAMSMEKSREILSREDQIAIIEKTFSTAKSAPRHPEHPEWQPVKIQEVFPHPAIRNEYTWVGFERYPKDEVAGGDEAATRANVIRSHSEKHHSLYLPRPGTEGSSTTTEGQEQFHWAQEYRRAPTGRVSELNNYYFMVYGDEVLYNRFQQRVNLRKRTQTNDDPNADAEIASRPTHITLDLQPPVQTSVEEDLFGANSDAEEAAQAADEDEDVDEAALFGEDSDEEAAGAEAAAAASAGNGQETGAEPAESDVDDEDEI